MTMNDYSQQSPLVLTDLDAWNAWLLANEDSSNGAWVLLAKKNVTTPTSLNYQDALAEALCSGWIDGQRRSFDETTFIQRFTPRRPRSNWSKRNVDIVEGLVAEGRLRERGAAEVAAAKADGRWESAYPRQSEMTVPDDLRDALARVPAAQAAFEQFTRSQRFTVMLPILTARSDQAKARIIARLVDRLGEGSD
ncbi:YdeI/OmpD-associated family protein [Brevibacterium sp. UCMA 11752]|uniref:YdeI/OmpD-associated family protein n=1 Tax=Brevibacterium sp. UCMA 11752 TaxID=2745946 RepID=UPI001F1D1DE8|nr:YdeI/OmpD-associated family protein [Brevibacterium sp. UCMA 11752]